MVENKKYYNVEIDATTKTMLKRIENFKSYLQNESITFETSGCFECIHFEILLSPCEVPKVNNALDKIVWYDAI